MLIHERATPSYEHFWRGQILPTEDGGEHPFIGDIIQRDADDECWIGELPDGRFLKINGSPLPRNTLVGVNTGNPETTGVYRVVSPPRERFWDVATRPNPSPRKVRAHKPYKKYKPRRPYSRPPPMSVDPIEFPEPPPGPRRMVIAEQAWCAREWLRGRALSNIGRECDLSSSAICTALTRFEFNYARRHAVIPPSPTRRLVIEIGLKTFIDGGGGLRPPRRQKDTRAEYDKRCELAWLLRSEGLTFRQIAERAKVSPTRAQYMVLKYARRMQRAVSDTRWTVVEANGDRRPLTSDMIEIDRAAQAAYEQLEGPWARASEEIKQQWRDLAAATVSEKERVRAQALRTLDEIEHRIRRMNEHVRRDKARRIKRIIESWSASLLRDE